MKKKEYIILALIIVLLGGYLFLRNTNRSTYELPVLDSASSDKFTRIEITASGETIDLVRSGDRWLIGELAYPADASRVSEMLSALEKLKLTALVSETGAYSPYDLTEDKKIEVRAWTGDRLMRDLAIGKTANTYQHTFVRLGEDPNVYHADGNFRQTFDQSVESLRDKTALSFNIGEITGIELVSGEKHLSLSLENQTANAEPSLEKASEKTDSEAPEPVWMTDGGAPADEEAVQRLLSQLAYLNCSGYLEGRKKEDFSLPAGTITLKGKETYCLSLYETEGSEMSCPAVSSQNAYPFTLSETACKRLRETLDAILGSEVVPDPAGSEAPDPI